MLDSKFLTTYQKTEWWYFYQQQPTLVRAQMVPYSGNYLRSNLKVICAPKMCRRYKSTNSCRNYAFLATGFKSRFTFELYCEEETIDYDATIVNDWKTSKETHNILNNYLQHQEWQAALPVYVEEEPEAGTLYHCSKSEVDNREYHRTRHAQQHHLKFFLWRWDSTSHKCL